MNEAYREVIAATEDDRRGLFLAAAQRLGTTLQNIEKDFWVCWTLDALFHRLPAGGPRFLFKGGTSLSKGYGLISRFSEDIDITVFREDLGNTATTAELEALTTTARRKRLDGIKQACQAYVRGPLLSTLGKLAAQSMEVAGRNAAEILVTPDANDPDGQSLLIHYPSVVDPGGYLRPVVKIESGAKSALDPHEDRRVVPYLASDLPNGNALAVESVTTIDPARTLIDKFLILHGLPIFFEKFGKLYGSGQLSRHYYDVHCLMARPDGKNACLNAPLIDNCIKHAQLFFYRKNTGLEDVARGSFRMMPRDGMLRPLRRDYEAMATMIFGAVPSFDALLESVSQAESLLNAI